MRTKELVGCIQCPNAPCIFIEGEAPIILGIYVDDTCYFSKSDAVEEKFEKEFGSRIKTTFNGIIDYFLGIKFTHAIDQVGNLTTYLSQEAFVENLVAQCNLDGKAVSCPPTPYRSGLPVDKIKTPTIPPNTDATHQDIQNIIDNIPPLTSQSPSDSKTQEALIRKMQFIVGGTSSLGISFQNTPKAPIESFVKFPIDPTKIIALTDANWDPQDQTTPK